jgi:hypothetical protein
MNINDKYKAFYQDNPQMVQILTKRGHLNKVKYINNLMNGDYKYVTSKTI